MSNPSHIFLWPDGSLREAFKGVIAPASTAAVEARLAAMFPAGHPVLVSSGRAGIALLLAHMGVGRGDGVALFPFASHCVLEAVARQGTPWHGATGTPIVGLTYHQWGYVQEHQLGESRIEDGVDSWCLTGAELFPGGSNYEVWSLAKIVGSTSGGVIWCRSARDAESLRRLREGRPGGLGSWLLRLAGRRWSLPYAWWAGRESTCAPLPRPATGEILHLLGRWPELTRARQERLELMQRFLPPWLSLRKDRLPCVVPVIPTTEQVQALTALGMATGWRTFERVHPDGQRELVRCFPVPIHHETPIAMVHAAARLLEGEP